MIYVSFGGKYQALHYKNSPVKQQWQEVEVKLF
jgi:hypothetical protein